MRNDVTQVTTWQSKACVFSLLALSSIACFVLRQMCRPEFGIRKVTLVGGCKYLRSP